MCVFYILWICYRGCNFISIYVINLIKCTKDERLATIEVLQEKNENKEGDLKKENDPIHGQYTNACKLGANWNGCKIFKIMQVDYNNLKFFSMIFFPNF
jgi:hypothetical protein